MAELGSRIEGVDAAGAMPTLQTKRRSRSWVRALDNSRWFPTLLITPILIFFIVWNLLPLLWLLGLSFYRYSLTGARPPIYVGFENFTRLWESTAFWGLLSRTMIFMVSSVVVATLLGGLLGLLFWGSAKMPGRRIALTLLFTPMILPPIAVATFYRLIYEPSFGVANYYLNSFFGTRVDFLGNPSWAFWSVVAVDVWMWTPFMTLMTLAALGSVPKAELEAAEVDRLSWFQRIRHVILPHGKFILALGILLRTIDAFKTTDLVFLLTRGGPGNVTELLGVSLYRTGFEAFQMGDASSRAVVALLVAISFTSIYLYVLNFRENRQSAMGEGH